MKRTLTILSVFFGLALSAFGQTALTATTLSAALNSSANSFTLASATGITAGSTLLYFEDGTGGDGNAGEAAFVNAVNGTTVSVTRGYYGTTAQAHLASTVVVYGPAVAFIAYEPSGACTVGQGAAQYQPAINTKTGNQWLCSSITNSWVPGFWNTAAYSGVTAAVASASALLPSGPLFHVTGTTGITSFSSAVGMGGTVSSPAAPAGAPFCIIPDGIFTVTAGNNIELGSTSVVGKLLCYTFDATNHKYVPSY